jgi:hypothetical protein
MIRGRTLGDLAIRAEHVSSTAVPGLAARPIVDVQLSVDRIEPRERYIRPLQRLGYLFVPAPESPDRYFFAKPPERPRAHHLHVCAAAARPSSATSRSGTSWSSPGVDHGLRGTQPASVVQVPLEWSALALPAVAWFAVRRCHHADASARPLAGLRVIAVEQYGAWPWGTMQLADLVADVVKIEDPATCGDVPALLGLDYLRRARQPAPGLLRAVRLRAHRAAPHPRRLRPRHAGDRGLDGADGRAGRSADEERTIAR